MFARCPFERPKMTNVSRETNTLTWLIAAIAFAVAAYSEFVPPQGVLGTIPDKDLVEATRQCRILESRAAHRGDPRWWVRHE